MKKLFLILLLIPVLAEAQTIKASNSTDLLSATGVILLDSTGQSLNNKALIVVDGVIMNQKELISLGNNPSAGAPDPESIAVIDGVSAMSIYGSRGANGAIIIATKKQVK